MSRRTGWMLASLVMAVFSGNVGCNHLAEILTGYPEGNVVRCSTKSDCTVEITECRNVLECEEGSCVFKNEPEGKALSEQTPGDCLQVQCDGKGDVRTIVVPTDIDDGNPCTLDQCDDSTPVHALKANFPCYTGAPGTSDVGACKQGLQSCDAEGNIVGACVDEVTPVAESCFTAEDDDCDGQTNEDGVGCVCTQGDTQSCYSGPLGTEATGNCHVGVKTCVNGLEFGACEGEQLPEVESCDAAGADEDCDGEVNEDGSNCFCGDGFVSPGIGEACDDGNFDPDDGCTNTCHFVECGNGVVQLGEICDDGNTVDGDACPAKCRYSATSISAGVGYVCVIREDSRVKCWGGNFSGQCGLGNVSDRGDEPNEMGNALPAVNLGTGLTAVAIAAKSDHTCALLNDGSVKCWGNNQYGQLGLGDTATRGNQPGEMGDALPAVNLGTNRTATAIAVGNYHTCAILDDGRVKCWGGNFGLLGLGGMDHRGDTPGEMGDVLPAINFGTGKTAVSISIGANFSCVLLNDGSVKCWGYNESGQLGRWDTELCGDELSEMGDNLPPVDLGTGVSVVALSTGFNHACVLLADGRMKCWGSNNFGQLGLGDALDRGNVPGQMGDDLPFVDLGAHRKVVAIALSSWSGFPVVTTTCALLEDGAVKCWGSNWQGKLGLGDTLDRGDEPGEMGDNLPTIDLGTGKTVTQLALGSQSCAILSDGDVKCWGNNEDGNLGQGDTIPRGDEPDEMGDALPFVLF